jgi:hypothetical protein
MKATLATFIIVIFGVLACSKTTLHANEDLAALQERFHGKYKVVTSTSDEAIDVNLDGVVSTDIKGEIPELVNSNLEIRIYQKEHPLFIQFWPEQYFSDNIRPDTYNSRLVINYANQSVGRLFKFDSDIKEVNMNPDKIPLPDSIHFPFPKSVTIETNDRIKVISPKQLFTRSGWKKVEITTIYERFTKKT